MRKLFPFLLLCGVSVFAAENLFHGGTFEAPVIQGRTPVDKGGDPTNAGRGPDWMEFKFSPANASIIGGLTDEVAHDGRQSLYIDFDHVKTAYQSATLVSNFIPVLSGTDYQVGIWGRTDAKDPISADGRPAYLKVEVDFFAADANESVGQPFLATQPLPGAKDRDPVFNSDSWNPFLATLTTPAGAVFAQITWRWETSGTDGETNGIMYFDDAMLAGPPNANPNLTPAPVKLPTNLGIPVMSGTQ
jgi:hypothetical protein